MKTASYSKLWQKIHLEAAKKGLPLRVMFELTYRCNFKCKHCYVPDSYRAGRKEIKTKEVFYILNQLRDNGCLYLGFTGGEPFMRKDILDILYYAKKCGFQIIIYTNASLIDEKIARELGRVGLNKVDITIPAISSRVFDSISGIKGSRDKTFNAIDYLRRFSVPLGFKTSLLRSNHPEIKRISKFSSSLGLPHRFYDVLSPRLDGSQEPLKYSSRKKGTLSDKDITQDFLKLSIGAKDMDLTELFRCGAGLSQAAITPKGELKMCIMIDYPKLALTKAPFKRAWRKMRGIVTSLKPDEDYQCYRCALKSYCSWCPARSWIKKRKFFACDEEFRLRALSDYRPGLNASLCP